jgi:hypothetical protein
MSTHPAAPIAAEVAIAKTVFERIRELLSDDDPDFVAIVESETNVLDLLRGLVRRSRRAEAEADAIDHMLKELSSELKERKERHVHRSEELRRIVRYAMEELQLRKIDAPDFSATLSMPAHGPLEVDDAAVPLEFCRVVKTPDKIRIRELLDGGLQPNWASYGPARPRLTIRIR